jgi:hypothetical protein
MRFSPDETAQPIIAPEKFVAAEPVPEAEKLKPFDIQAAIQRNRDRREQEDTAATTDPDPDNAASEAMEEEKANEPDEGPDEGPEEGILEDEYDDEDSVATDEMPALTPMDDDGEEDIEYTDEEGGDEEDGDEEDDYEEDDFLEKDDGGDLEQVDDEPPREVPERPNLDFVPSERQENEAILEKAFEEGEINEKQRARISGGLDRVEESSSAVDRGDMDAKEYGKQVDKVVAQIRRAEKAPYPPRETARSVAAARQPMVVQQPNNQANNQQRRNKRKKEEDLGPYQGLETDPKGDNIDMRIGEVAKRTERRERGRRFREEAAPYRTRSRFERLEAMRRGGDPFSSAPQPDAGPAEPPAALQRQDRGAGDMEIDLNARPQPNLNNVRQQADGGLEFMDDYWSIYEDD